MLETVRVLPGAGSFTDTNKFGFPVVSFALWGLDAGVVRRCVQLGSAMNAAGQKSIQTAGCSPQLLQALEDEVQKMQNPQYRQHVLNPQPTSVQPPDARAQPSRNQPPDTRAQSSRNQPPPQQARGQAQQRGQPVLQYNTIAAPPPPLFQQSHPQSTYHNQPAPRERQSQGCPCVVS
jgi:hypothetical protein